MNNEHLLGVLSGEEAVKVDIDNQDLYFVAGAVFLGMFMAVLLGGLLVERLK